MAHRLEGGFGRRYKDRCWRLYGSAGRDWWRSKMDSGGAGGDGGVQGVAFSSSRRKKVEGPRVVGEAGAAFLVRD